MLTCLFIWLSHASTHLQPFAWYIWCKDWCLVEKAESGYMTQKAESGYLTQKAESGYMTQKAESDYMTQKQNQAT